MIKSERNYGVDLLRVLAMFMIVLLHLLRQGGVVESVEPNSLNFHITWLLEALCYSAVNVYALISGYVLCEKKFHLSRMINLWLSIVFYTFSIFIIMYFIGKEPINLNNIANAILPITRHQYWYLSSYFGLLLLSPFLNKAFVSFDKKELFLIICLSFLLVSILPSLCYSDPFYMHGGFSTLWLCALYLVGGGLKKCDFASKLSSKSLLLIIFFMAGVTYFSKLGLVYIFEKFGMHTNGCTFYTYISPTIIVMSVAFFLLFCNRKIAKYPLTVINFFSPMTLGVYIIHANPLVWKHLIKDISSTFVSLNAFFFFAAVLSLAITIYFICSIIDFVRIKLFQLFCVKRFIESIENKLMDIIGRIL